MIEPKGPYAWGAIAPAQPVCESCRMREATHYAYMRDGIVFLVCANCVPDLSVTA